MNILKITLLFVLLEIGGCAVTNYNSLEECQSAMSEFQPPKEGEAGNVKIVGQKVNQFMVSDNWIPIITHVDCHPVSRVYKEIYITPGEHSIRVRLSPIAVAEVTKTPLFIGPDLAGAALIGGLSGAKNTVPMRNSELSAQTFKVNLSSNKMYKLYMRQLPMWDSAFWLLDANNNVIFKSENVKEKWIESDLSAEK